VNDLEFRLVNDYQRDFPLCAEPFAEIARRVGASADAVMEAYARLAAGGALSRIGAVFGANRVGASTLAAMRVPAARLEEVAQRVSSRAEVNHNYEREHEWNLWFVATAPDAARLAAALAAIERDCGLPVMRLPLEEDFHIDLGFDLRDGSVPARGARRGGERVELERGERALLAALQSGLPIVARPYRELAARAGVPESEVAATIGRWLAQGVVKRFGVVVRHHELGYGANAMVVWDVPDREVARIGERLAQSEGVTLCYRRPRVPPHWDYNLFCMIHGTDRAYVLQQVDALRSRWELTGYRHEVLFSRRRFKQRGARYAESAAGLPDFVVGS